MGWRSLFIALVLALPVGAAQRSALVIGNDAYPASPLGNAVRDARAMIQALRQTSFRVEGVENGTLAAMEEGLARWASGLRPGDVALFYFAGHGVQLAGENYLIPVDFRARTESGAKAEALAASRVSERMEQSGARLNIVILDACRNNPFRQSRGMSHSLAAMAMGRGTLIALSTGPGSTASDGPEAQNGLFTGFLIEALQEPELNLDEVFNRVKMRVRESTHDEQAPWVHSSVIGTFYFRPPKGWHESSARPMETPRPAAPPPQPALTPQARAEAEKALRDAERGLASKQWPAAVADLQRAISLNPEFGEAHLQLGIARAQLGQADAALEALDRAVALLPRSAAARLQRAVVLNEQMQYERAATDLTEALRLQPDLAAGYWHRSLARARLGDREGSAADLRRFRDLRRRAR